jgi:hypothetical protein
MVEHDSMRAQAPKPTRPAFRALCDELQRTSCAIAAAVDLLDAGVLEPPDRDQLIAQLRRRVEHAVGTVARAMQLAVVEPDSEPDIAGLREGGLASEPQALHLVPLWSRLRQLADRLTATA